ncbi:MAG: hypothetical protein ABIO72_05405 [Patescibacteria group bacterium]
MQQEHVKRANAFFSEIIKQFEKQEFSLPTVECSADEMTKTYTVALTSRGDSHDFSWWISHGERTSTVTVRMDLPGCRCLTLVYDAETEHATFSSQEADSSPPESSTTKADDLDLAGVVVALVIYHNQALSESAEMAATAV